MHLGRTVEELEQTLSSAELTRWIAYAGIEPFGYPMDNYRFGVATTTITNAIYSTIPIPKGKRRPKPLAPADFYPQRKKREPDLTPEQQAYIERKKRGRGK